MSPLEITKELKDVTVEEGGSAALLVEARTDAAGPLGYAWTKDGEALDGDGSSYAIADAASEDGGRYAVKVSDGAEERTSSAQVTIRARPLLWLPRFAVGAAVGLAALFVVVLLPLWVTAKDLIGDDPGLASVIAFQLVVLGTVALLAGLYLALLELRGRARTAEELLRRPSTPAKAGQAFGVGDKAVEAVPAALKEFGKLQAPAALLVVAVALFAGAAAIGWRSLPDPSPSPPTTTTTTETGG